MGSVERKHTYSVETSLALLASGLVPKQYWVEAFQTVVYLINRLPTKILNYISPYEKLIGHFQITPFYKCLATRVIHICDHGHPISLIIGQLDVFYWLHPISS